MLVYGEIPLWPWYFDLFISSIVGMLLGIPPMYKN